MVDNLSRARKLVLDLLKADEGIPEREKFSAMEEKDWDELLRIARAHRLGPMLFFRLSRCDHEIPDEIMERLLQAHRRNAVRSLKVFGELVKVSRRLESAGMPFIALKGAHLAQFCYPSPACRPMRDLDLLLKKDRCLEAFDLLVGNGYVPAIEGSAAAHMNQRRHLPPLRSPSGIQVELHHGLIAPHPSFRMDEELIGQMWSRNISRKIGQDPVRFFCPEDLLFHLCIHATLEHDFDLGPLALADIALLLGSEPLDWNLLLEEIIPSGWRKLVLAPLYLARLHLDAAVPEDVLDALGSEVDPSWRRSAEYLLFSESGNHSLPHKDVLNMLNASKSGAALSSMAKILLPSPAVIALNFPAPPDSWRAYRYYPAYVLRLFTLKLPGLMKALDPGKGNIGEYARHRRRFSDWLCEEK